MNKEEKQRILAYQKVPATEKLQHVYEMNVFFSKYMPEESKRIKEQLRKEHNFK